MRTLNFKTFIVLCLIVTFSMSALAQDRDDSCESCNKKKHKIELDLESALSCIPDLEGIGDLEIFTGGKMKELTTEAAKLGTLLDLDAWEDEISELVDLTRKESKKASKLLERLRALSPGFHILAERLTPFLHIFSKVLSPLIHPFAERFSPCLPIFSAFVCPDLDPLGALSNLIGILFRPFACFFSHLCAQLLKALETFVYGFLFSKHPT